MKASLSLAGEPEQFFDGLQTYSPPVSRIAAIGVEVPGKTLSNEALVEMIDAPEKLKRLLPKIIARSTGNHQRLYAGPDTVPSDLAVAAARQAMTRAGWEPSSIDTLIFASTDTDTLEPATANILQEKLGMTRINAFDLSNACNSILQGINVANSLIATGAARRVLIASGEIGSWVCNHRIESISDLRVKMGGLTLGDAGAALLMEPATGPDGIIEINLLSVGEYWHLCHVPANEDWRAKGGTMHPWFYLDMPALARVVREFSIAYLGHYTRRRAPLTGERRITDSIDWFVPHQISKRLIEEGCRKLEMDMAKVCITADRYGNTASTSIPLALDHLQGNGCLLPGSGQQAFLFGAASGFGLGHVRLVF